MLADLLVLVAGVALVLAWFDLDLFRRTATTPYGVEYLSMTESAGGLLVALGLCVVLMLGVRRLQFGGMPGPVEWALLTVMLAEASRRARTGIDPEIDLLTYAGLWALAALVSGLVVATMTIASKPFAPAHRPAPGTVRLLAAVASLALIAIGVVWDQVGKATLGLLTAGCFTALVCLRDPRAAPVPARVLVWAGLLLTILNSPLAVLRDRWMTPIVVGTTSNIPGDAHAFLVFDAPPHDWAAALRWLGPIESTWLPVGVLIAALSLTAIRDALRRGRSRWTCAELAGAMMLVAFGLCNALDVSILATDPANPHRVKDSASRLLWAAVATFLGILAVIAVDRWRSRRPSVASDRPIPVPSRPVVTLQPRGPNR
jgi:hypothetical protein